MKHQIKNRYTGNVIFECELPDYTPSGMSTRYALEKALQSDANLSDANLSGANLSDANLRWANLSDANLSGANLSDANLRWANLSGANLREANLSGANLRGANLIGANLSDANLRWANLSDANLSGANLSDANLRLANLREAKLIGDRPFFQIGPIGSRCDYLTALITDQGVKLKAGCFFGTVEEFTAKLSETHKDNDHAKEYQMALMMIEAHAAIWTPKETK